MLRLGVLRGLKQADLVVVVERPHRKAGALGHFADFDSVFLYDVHAIRPKRDHPPSMRPHAA